ncbi:FG-GAP repeat domain-containing protein [Leifsonia sp. EB41]|uniref:FG-GAP repeat domain-containing protein n=1 Tax=Leifsonia sp. EB41 TaxID=3156260 RepID=UPI0035120D28
MLATIGALIVGLGLVSAPAGAATTITASNLAGTTDCSSLQNGYYPGIHVTGSLAGLTPSAPYTVGVYSRTNGTQVGSDIALVTDAQGAATIDAALTGQVVSYSAYGIQVRSGSTLVFARGVFLSSRCDPGVAPTGQLTADMVCPTRFLTYGGIYGSQNVDATSFHVHGTLTGFVPGQTYQLEDYQGGKLDASVVADASGALSIDMAFTDTGSQHLSDNLFTSSQGQSVGTEYFAPADPCPAIKPSTQHALPNHDGDVNGDGAADLLAIDLNGRLLEYQNTHDSHPFGAGQVIGSGWGSQFAAGKTVSGDITGDGYAEIVAIRSDGALVAYYNNMAINPGHLPYSSGTVIGSGWQAFTNITLGDINGDGYADLIAERSDGTFWVYLNGIRSNPGHLPFSTGRQLAGTFSVDPNGFAAGDLNGDGYADLFALDSWVNPNRTAAGASAPFGELSGASPWANGNISYANIQAGWALGDYLQTGNDGLLIANPGDGSLVLVGDAMNDGGSGTVIGSGWQAIRQIIP